jgi:uncharacterized protein
MGAFRGTLAAAALLAMLAPTRPCRGDVVYTTPGSVYASNFTSPGLAQSGTNNPWTDDSTVIGWFANRTSYIADTGTSTTGGLHSYGVPSLLYPPAYRSLGSIASDSVPLVQYGVRLTNSTGVTLNSVTITYDGEQWRNAGNTTPHSLTVAYKLGESPLLADIDFVAIPELTFTGPIATATSGALDGHNPPNNVTGITKTLTGISWDPGAELFVRWTDVNDAGSDHALAIVNVKISAAVVPELSATWFGGLACCAAGVGAWRRRRA